MESKASTGERHEPRSKGASASSSNGKELASAATDIASSVADLYKNADAYLGSAVRKRPYAVLGAAAGVGFVIAGGLSSWLSRTALGVGARLLVARVLDDAVARAGDD